MTIDMISFAFGFVSGMVGLIFMLTALSLIIWKMAGANSAEPSK